MKYFNTSNSAYNILRYILALILYFQTNYIIAQKTQAKGYVKGIITSSKGRPLSNVSIMLQGTKIGTSTDQNGAYNFTAPEGSYKLKASFMGYKPREKKITIASNKTSKVNLVLSKSSENLNEIVIDAQHESDIIVLNSNTATKSNMSIMDTPAPIVAVKKEILDQQGITNLQDAIRNISGVTQAGNNFGIGDNLVIRGLDANYTLDGMYSGAGNGNNYNPTRSLTNVDKIEVLKGPATGLYGIGSAGGVINFVEKKPLFKEQGLAEVRVGQWDHFRGMLDYTAPLSDKFAFRIVSASQIEDGYRDVSSERFETYGALTFKSSIHNLTVSGAVIEDEYDIDSVGDPVRLITPGLLDNFDVTSLVNDNQVDADGNFIGIQLTDAQRQELANSLLDTDGVSPFDIGDHSLITGIADPNEGKEYRIKLRYDITPIENLSISNQLLYRTYESEFTRQTGALNYVYFDQNGVINQDPRSPLVINDILYPLAARRQEYRRVETKEKAFQYFGDFKYDWNLGKIKGEHLLSVNYEDRNINFSQRSIVDADNIFGTGETNVVPYILDITNESAIKSIVGNFEDFAEVTRRTSIYEKDIIAYGVGFQEVLYLNKQLTARLGAAYSKIEQKFEDVDADLPVFDFDDSGFTYNLGLTYRPIDQLSIFGNYSKGVTAFSLTGSISENNESNRDNSEATSIDLGARFKTKDNSLLASVVFFQTARTNIGYSNTEFDEVDNPNVPQFFYDREDRTEGVELDVNYSLNKQVSFNLNATYQEPKTLTDEEVTTEQTKGVPKRYARFWSEYKHFFKNSTNPLLFNFGVRYEDERTIDGFGNTFAHIDSYVVFDAGLGFLLNNKWNFRLNANNILDKDYHSIALFAGALPGDTRNFVFTTQYKF